MLKLCLYWCKQNYAIKIQLYFIIQSLWFALSVFVCKWRAFWGLYFTLLSFWMSIASELSILTRAFFYYVFIYPDNIPARRPRFCSYQSPAPQNTSDVVSLFIHVWEIRIYHTVLQASRKSGYYKIRRRPR